MRVIGGRVDRQYLADRLDPTLAPMIIDERDRSWPEPAVELRLGKIRRRLAQDLVGLAQLPDLALKLLDTGLLDRRHNLSQSKIGSP